MYVTSYVYVYIYISRILYQLLELWVKNYAFGKTKLLDNVKLKLNLIDVSGASLATDIFFLKRNH